FRDDAGDGHVAERLARQPRQAWRNVDRSCVVGERYGTVDPSADSIQHARRKQMLVLDGQVLVAGMFACERDGRLARRLPVNLAVVERIAAKQCVAAFEAMIDPALREVLVRRLLTREQVLRRAATQRAAVRAWEEKIEICGDRRVEAHLSSR